MNANSTLTRRSLLAAAPAAASIALVIPSTAYALARGNPDAELLAAWEVRNRSIAAIERHGTFFDAEDTSPAEAEAFDLATEFIGHADAHTLQGVLAKLWVAMEACGSFVSNDAQREHQNITRRANIADVAAIDSELEWDHRAVFTTIKSVAAQIVR